MKGIKIFFLALVAGLLLASCDSAEKGGEGGGEGDTTENKENMENKAEPAAPAEAYGIALDGAEVMWTASKEEGAHYGGFGLSGGSLMVSSNGIDGGDATIDLTAMTVLDEGMDEESKGKLAGHLSSPDFFNVEAHPSIMVKINGSEAYGGAGETIPDDLPDPLENYFVTAPTHNIMATLTIKGEEHELTFPASIKLGDGSLDAAAFITFDRREMGLRFGGDAEATVNPTVHVGLKFGAAKQAS